MAKSNEDILDELMADVAVLDAARQKFRTSVLAAIAVLKADTARLPGNGVIEAEIIPSMEDALSDATYGIQQALNGEIETYAGHAYRADMRSFGPSAIAAE
ncbi:hypothetical protein VPG91_11655 [Nitrospirillum amazonense]|uniref:hypothetical protein n=1 Tax=Nitrospirillum amazonense TaxID=28077 RepID=UPI002DD44261|nr:hypothetical protein [Nitrospirillum amazonense]MEC4591645.1 hypothetical protein [Nitrospirillum amazonense]